jgi:hypothetical protein
MELTECRRKF